MARRMPTLNSYGFATGGTLQLRIEYKLENGKKLLPGLCGRVISVSKTHATIQTNPNNRDTIYTLPNYLLAKVRQPELVGGS